MSELLPVERIENKIYVIRRKKVMLDFDLARLYGISTGRLNEQVKRNVERFPEDFMFSLTRHEIIRISQFAISLSVKYSKNINAFTEQGVAMLSSVLRSKRAIQVNIAIMRVFIRLKKIISNHKDLLRKIGEIERKTDKNTVDIQLVFRAIRNMLEEPAAGKKRIGFLTE